MIKKLAAAALAVLTTVPAVAGSYTDALASCLGDHTTGKERKELARWIFIAMSAHPEIRDLSNVSTESKERAFRTAGSIFTRLLTENCASQARAAIQNEGAASFQNAFGVLGQLAMQELTSNADVNAALLGFDRYIDRKKLEGAFAPK
jgi:hypothetical protein